MPENVMMTPKSFLKRLSLKDKNKNGPWLAKIKL
jgi:hypothetical protein